MEWKGLEEKTMTEGHFIVPARGDGTLIRLRGHEGNGEKGPDLGSTLEEESVGIQVGNSEKQTSLGVSIWTHLEAMGLGEASKGCSGRRVEKRLHQARAAPTLFH